GCAWAHGRKPRPGIPSQCGTGGRVSVAGCASLIRAANDQSRSRPSTHSEARSAAAIDPDRAAAPAPVAVFLATGAGDLLHHHRAALAPVPVAGATALVVAAAGHAVVPAGPRAWAMARRGTVAGGEFRAAAVVHPEGVAALAPGAAFDAGGPRQLPHQHGAAADGAGLPPVVAALAAHQLAVAAAPAAAALGEASTAAVVHPHRAAAAAEVAALDAARAGDVLDQHRATLERGAAFAPAAVVAGAHQGGPGPAGSAPAPAVAAAERPGDVAAYLGHAPAILDPVEVIGQLVVGDGAPA